MFQMRKTFLHSGRTNALHQTLLQLCENAERLRQEDREALRPSTSLSYCWRCILCKDYDRSMIHCARMKLCQVISIVMLQAILEILADMLKLLRKTLPPINSIGETGQAKVCTTEDLSIGGLISLNIAKEFICFSMRETVALSWQHPLLPSLVQAPLLDHPLHCPAQ